VAVQPSVDEAATLPAGVGAGWAQTVPVILRLFGAGASGSIVLALGDGPLRTKELTARVPGFAPRTVYRYVSRLVELGAIDREEEPGVPSKVVHSLSDPCGMDLRDLVEAFASASLEVLPDGRIVPHSWGSLTLLADLWESGMFRELNAGACTATELARVEHDLSFHQVSRRTSLFTIGGLIRETEDGGRHRRYELTEQARHQTAMIAGIGRWREKHAGPAGEPGLTAAETAELLKAALPLVAVPEHAGKVLELVVTTPEGGDGGEGEVAWAVVDDVGQVLACNDPPEQEADGCGRAPVGGWLEMLLRESDKEIAVDGDASLVGDCLQGVQQGLWTRLQPAA
jgi:DNA-binding HxlR family transcriptional regulator